jgi:tetratricopeptide (TPR) repeat protein
MAGCTDNRFEKMLYAYELGMLSDEDRAAVEMHQLECEHCFERAKRFREAARLLQVDPTVRQSIRQMSQDDVAAREPEVPENVIPAAGSKVWSIGVKTALAAAAVLLILILRPWKIEIGPKQEAIAAENLLAIMYFGNVADPGDPQKLGDIITNLLMTGLSESDYIQVVSGERLYDLLKLLGQDKLKTIDETTAFKVAEKANARWMLTGNILQTEPAYIITSLLIDVSSGNIVSTEKITGDSGMTVFALADSLSARIRADLPLAAKTAGVEPNRLVADMTTHSQEAFRYYLEGLDYYYRVYNAEAITCFEKVLEYDSTFAMAYFYLAELDDRSLLAKAVEYAEKATQKDRYYIEGRQAIQARDIPLAMSIHQQLIDRYPQEKQAYHSLAELLYEQGRYDDAIDQLNYAIALDPLFGNAYNMLSYCYGRLGDLDRALEMNDKYIFLSPNDPNPYDSRGEILAAAKQYDRAMESFRKAIEKKPDFYVSWRNLGNMYTYTGDLIKAESCFQVTASVEDIYVWTSGKIPLVQNLIYRGKYREALAVLADGIRQDQKAHGREIYSTCRHFAALIGEQLGDFTAAREEIAKAQEIAQRVSPHDKIFWRRYYVRILAAAGDTASARRIADDLRASLEEANRKQGDYWYALGSIAMAKGDLVNAEISFRKATVENDSFDYSAHFFLGRALLDLNRLDDAIEQFTILLADQKEHPERWGSWNAEVFYYLGIAYERSGRPREAIENFTAYLDIRKSADPQVPSVNDARTRRAALIAGSSS